jgi:transposase-like protein
MTPPRPARERSGAASHARGAQPLSDETRERIIALATQEMSVRAIAAAVGCSTGSVSNVCRLAGIPLDKGQTRAAAAARKVQAETDRAELASELAALARDELARLRRPHREYWGVGGAEPVVLSQLMPEPPPRARRDLISGAMALVDRHLKLTAVDAGNSDSLSNVDAWLAGMTGGSE